MSQGDPLKTCADSIRWALDEKGFKPGYYQAEWRDWCNGKTDFDIEYGDGRDCMLAVLDALIHQGGVAAWAGDGTSCVTQMIEFAYKRRDYWRKRALEAKNVCVCVIPYDLDTTG